MTSSPFVLGFKENFLNTEIGKATLKNKIYETVNEIGKPVISKGVRDIRIINGG